jgi:biopolymer transport protein ExbD
LVHRPSKKRFQQEPEEAIHIVALWNLMIILIPFLLLSAVFSRTAILNVYLPEALSAEKKLEKATDDHAPLLMVSILKDGFVIHDGEKVLAALPRVQDRHDFERLSSLLLQLKGQIPHHEEVILLSEPEIRYETIIQTMDASREAVVERDGKKEVVSLFPNVSIGEVGEITFREVLISNGR